VDPPHSIWGGCGPYPSSYALDAMTVSPGAKKIRDVKLPRLMWQNYTPPSPTYILWCGA